MKPVQILIRRKTRVPTKHQIKHLWRTDWRQCGKINYIDSYKLFKRIGNGPIETDAQFARFIFEAYGPGTYICIFWKKGVSGFRRFIYLEVKNDSFRIVKKEKTFEQRQKEASVRHLTKLRNELKKLKSMRKDTFDIEEKIKEAEEDVNINEEIVLADLTNKNAPYPYLTITKPRYSFHPYEPINKPIKARASQEVEANEFW